MIGFVLSNRVVDQRPPTALRHAVILTSICLSALGSLPGVVSTGIRGVLWGLAFGALPTLIQSVALRAVPTHRRPLGG